MVTPRLAGALVLSAVPALAQEIDNLQHAEGTKTCQLGELGAVVEKGDGDVTLLLLSGAPFGASVWEDFMNEHADEYTMYAVTPAGYEDTNPPPMPDDVMRADGQEWTGALLNAIDELIDAEQINEFVVVGHHLMSDYYALKIAQTHPDKVRAAVLAAPTLQMIAYAAGYSHEQRVQFVHQQRIPFFQTVTDDVWEQNTFQPAAFSTNEARADLYYRRQLMAPMPTQIRYYVEYFTTDEPELPGEIAAPVHLIPPPRAAALTAEQAIKSTVDTIVAQGLTEEDARERVEQGILAQYGTMEAFEQMLDEQARPWESVTWAGGLIVHDIPDAGVMVMLDQPAKFAEVIARIVRSLP